MQRLRHDPPRIWNPPNVHGGDKIVRSQCICLDCAHIITITAAQPHLVQDFLRLLWEESLVLVEELANLLNLG